jgi:F-type H+-transporting ATPase subunit delta
MQASDRLLAQRYAKALFDAAAKQDAGDDVRVELADSVRRLRDHEKTFKHPLLPSAEKKKAHRKILGGKSSPLVSRFLDVLIDKKRWSLLPLTITGFDKILDDSKGIARAQVRSARPLADAEKEKLRKGLEKFSGKKVQVEVKEDPSLIGGVVVRMGDWVLDASLSRRLVHLRERMAGTES